jgi:glycosyltransferase involved in cell wall biosynthesis
MSRRFRMLMVSPAAPWPATTGGLVRIAGILQQMARHFDLTFLSPRRLEQQIPPDLPARFVCPPIGDAGPLRRGLAFVDPARPFHAALYGRPAIARLVQAELQAHRYDVVYSHFIYGMQYLTGSRVPAIVDQQNVDRVYWQNKADHSGWPMKGYAAWNTRRTIGYETRVLPSIWAYVSVSDDDRDQTRAYASPLVEHFWVAPNGVDTHRFRPAVSRSVQDGVVTLGYLGSMDLQMNIEAVERFAVQLLPRIRAAVPGTDVKFVVIGRAPSARLMTLASSTPGMSLSGTVDDVVPWLQQVDVLVSPLRIGAGTKLKVAEAMSCGLPVVGSPLAFAGVPGRSGEHFLCTRTDDEFVSAVCGLVKDPVRRRLMGERARQLAQAFLDWDAIGDRLAEDIRDGLATRARDLDG